MAEIEKVIDGLYRLRSDLKFMCAGIHRDYYNNSMIYVSEAIQTIRELQEQIPKWHLCKNELPSEHRIIAVDNFGQVFIPLGDIFVLENSNGETTVYEANTYEFNIEKFLKGVEVKKGVRLLPREIIAWMELPKFEEVE